MKKLFVTVVLALIAAPAIPAADDKPIKDEDFLIKATTQSGGQMKLADYAAKNASDAKVREFAAGLSKDHDAMIKGLTDHAKRLKVAVVIGKDKETSERLDRLGRAKGVEVDLEFLQDVIDTHKAMISMFEAEIKDATDANMRTFAKENLTGLKKHLDEANDHYKRLKK